MQEQAADFSPPGRALGGEVELCSRRGGWIDRERPICFSPAYRRTSVLLKSASIWVAWYTAVGDGIPSSLVRSLATYGTLRILVSSPLDLLRTILVLTMVAQTTCQPSNEKGSRMTNEDRTLSCNECGQSFIFSADDQAYHAEKGYTNEPKRCPACRQAKRAQRNDDGFDRGGREMHPVVCAECGKDTTVPFLPRGDRPVYCSDCFRRQGTPANTGRY